MATINILSIDAWASPSGWDWNAWYKIGTIESETLDTLDSDEKILTWLTEEGYLNAGLKLGETVVLDDDGYNVVVCDPSVIDAPEDCEDSDHCEHQHAAMPVIAIAIAALAGLQTEVSTMMHAYLCEMDLALTYSMRRGKLARQCARRALDLAHTMRRPDLAWFASEIMSAVGR